MIINVLNEDVFNTDLKHIAFAINTEGYNDAGFAGQVSKRAPQLANTGEQKLGDVITVEANGKQFHGLVCHSLSGSGWKNAPEAICNALDMIVAPDDEPIAVVLMGAGMIGQMSGANVVDNTKAIHASKKKCVLHTFEYTKGAVLGALGLKQLPV
jgi:hypothetical protein